MTQPCAETIEREKDKLYVTDAELIRRLGVPAKTGRRIIKGLDEMKNSGFPRKSKFFVDRRYWPAVQAFFASYDSPTMEPPQHRRNGNVRTHPAQI